MSFSFNAPATAGSDDRLAPADIVGQLLIIRPLEHVQGVTTTFGEKDGIKVDAVVLTQQNPDGTWGVVYRGALWFQGGLIGSLKTQIGTLVLARMGLGTGKPGQKPPFQLEDATADGDAVQFASQWMSQHPDFVTELQAPAPRPAAAPAAAPIPTPAAVPAAVPAPVAAAPATAPAAPAGGYDPSVLQQLSPEVIAQLQALQAQQSAA